MSHQSNTAMNEGLVAHSSGQSWECVLPHGPVATCRSNARFSESEDDRVNDEWDPRQVKLHWERNIRPKLPTEDKYAEKYKMMEHFKQSSDPVSRLLGHSCEALETFLGTGSDDKDTKRFSSSCEDKLTIILTHAWHLAGVEAQDPKLRRATAKGLQEICGSWGLRVGASVEKTASDQEYQEIYKKLSRSLDPPFRSSSTKTAEKTKEKNLVFSLVWDWMRELGDPSKLADTSSPV